MPDKSLLSHISKSQDKPLNDNALQRYVDNTPTVDRDDVSLSSYIYKKLGVGTLNIGGALAGFGAGAARTVGMEDTGDYLGDLQEDINLVSEGINKEAGGTVTAVQGEDSLYNKYKRGELGAGDVMDYIGDVALTQAPQFLVGGAAAKAGTAFAPLLMKIPKIAKVKGASETIGALLGQTAAMTAQETGSIYGEQEDKNFGKALAYGAPAGILESVSQLHGMKRSGLGGFIAKNMEQKGEKSIKRIGLDILKSATEEGLTEASQSVLEHVGAAETNNPIEALGDLSATEILENAIAGVVMGGGMTTAGNVMKKGSDVTKRKLKPLAERAVDELVEEAATEREEEVSDGVSDTSIIDGAESQDDIEASDDAQKKADVINEGVAAAEAVIDREAAEQEVPSQVNAAAQDVGADPVEMHSFASSVYSSVKNAAEFTSQMVAKFGSGIKKHVIQMWNYFKSKLGEDRGSFSTKKLSMQLDNIEKIIAGKKTATSRTGKIELGEHELSDGTKINITKRNEYKNINEMKDPEAWAIDEGFDSLADMRENAKYKHTKDFIDGKRGMNVATFELSAKKLSKAEEITEKNILNIPSHKTSKLSNEHSRLSSLMDKYTSISNGAVGFAYTIGKSKVAPAIHKELKAIEIELRRRNIDFDSYEDKMGFRRYNNQATEHNKTIPRGIDSTEGRNKEKLKDLQWKVDKIEGDLSLAIDDAKAGQVHAWKPQEDLDSRVVSLNAMLVEAKDNLNNIQPESFSRSQINLAESVEEWIDLGRPRMPEGHYSNVKSDTLTDAEKWDALDAEERSLRSQINAAPDSEAYEVEANRRRDRYKEIQKEKELLSPKDALSTLPHVPAAEKEKAPFKASKSNKYIGFGNKSTKHYADQLRKHGMPVNNEDNAGYTKDDVIFVSVNGSPKVEDFNKTVDLAVEALETGAILITDSESYLKNNKYNQGEQALANELLSLGYERTTTKGNKNSALWKKKEISSAAETLVEDDWTVEEDVIDEDWFVDSTGEQTDGKNLSYDPKSPEHRKIMWEEAKDYLPPNRMLTDEEIRAFDKYLVDIGISEDGRAELYAQHAEQIGREDRNADYEEEHNLEAQLNERSGHSWQEGLEQEEMNLDEGSTFVKTDRQVVVTDGKTFVAPEKLAPKQSGESDQQKLSDWKLGKKYESIKTIDFFLNRKKKIRDQSLADQGMEVTEDVANDPNYYDETTIDNFEADNEEALASVRKEMEVVRDQKIKVRAEIEVLEGKEQSGPTVAKLKVAKQKLKKLEQKTDFTELSDNDIKEGRNSLLDIMLHEIATALPNAYVPSVINFIKKEEGVRSLAALPRYPDSLTELISHAKTMDDNASADQSTFQEEHDASVIAAEEFQDSFQRKIKDRPSTSDDVPPGGVNIEKTDVGTKIVTAARNKEVFPITSVTPDTTRKKSQKRKNAEEKVDNRNKGRAATEKRKSIKEKRAENQKKTHDAVMAMAKENQIMISMFPDFFDIIKGIISGGKHQAINNIRTQDVMIKLTMKNEIFAKSTDEKGREAIVRRMILLVNGLGNDSFKTYSTRQEQEGNPEALHSTGAENTEAINSEMSQLGGAADIVLIDAFEEYVTSQNLINYMGSYLHYVSYVDKSGKKHYANAINYQDKMELIKKYGGVKVERPSVNQETPFGMNGKDSKDQGVTHGLIDVRINGEGEKFTVSYRTYLSSWNLVANGSVYNAKPGTRMALGWIASNDLEKLVETIIEKTDLVSNQETGAYVLARDLGKAKTMAQAANILKEFHESADKETINAFYERIFENKDEFGSNEEYIRLQEKIDRKASRKVTDHAHTKKGYVAFYKFVGRAYMTLSAADLKSLYEGIHNGKIAPKIMAQLKKQYFGKEHFPEVETLTKTYRKIGRPALNKYHKYMTSAVKAHQAEKDLGFYSFFSKLFVTSLAEAYRAEYVMDHLNKNLLSNPQMLKDLAAEYKAYGVTEVDITNAYVSLAGNKFAIANFLSGKMQEHFNQLAEKALSGHPSIKEAKAYALGRSSKKIQKLAAKYWGKDKSKLDISSRAELEALEYLVNDIGLTKETVRKPILKDNDSPIVKALRDIEEAAKRENVTEVATTKHTVGLEVYPEDVFSPKEATDAFEKQIVSQNADLESGRALEVGTLKSKLADIAYRKLAKLFGADLVIVNQPNGKKKGYRSRYIPKSKADGRSKLVINMSQQVKFSSLFAHELFHHVVNKADPAQYKAFTDELAKLASSPDRYLNGKNTKSTFDARQALRNNEEIQAELFAEVMFSSSFYEALSKTSAGKSLAMKLMKRLIGIISKMSDLFNSKAHRWSYEFDGMINDRDMKKAIDLMASLVADSFERTELRHNEKRYHTTVGSVSKKELEQISENKDKWLRGIWKKIFPKGTKNYKELMTGIQDLVVKALKVMAKIKPQGFIADWMSDETAVKYAHWLQNYPTFHVTKARKQVVNARKNVYREFINQRVEELSKQIDEGTYTVNGVKVNTANKSLIAELKRNLPRTIIQTLHDDIVRDQLDFGTGTKNTKRQEADIKKAKELGYNDEIIETFQAYKKITDELFIEMKKVFPHLKMMKSHYGQSIKWFHEGNVTMDESFDRILTGSNRMMKGKDLDRTTQQIADDENLVYETMDPHELFLNYVRDASRLMQFHKVVNAAIKSGHAKIFTGKQEANAEGFKPVVDSATRVIRELMGAGNAEEFVVRDSNGDLINKNGRPMAFETEAEANAFVQKYTNKTNKEATIETQVSAAKAKIAYWAVSEKVIEDQGTVIFHGEEIKNEEITYEELKRFVTEAEAIEYANSLDVETKVEASFSVAKSDDVAQIYFSEDLAKLINITLAEDKFRNGKLLGIQGKHALWVKNAMTSFEFALSAFHFITISIELMASYATWQQLRFSGNRKFFTGFNVVKGWRDSRELSALITTILTDIDYANDPAVLKRANELLGTNDVDILDVIKQYFTAGGLEQQDPDLRSRMNTGQMRYATGTGDHIVVEGGEMKTVYGKMSAKAMMDSYRDVYADELANHPDHPALAKAKTAMFIGAESATSWLMEGFIPKVKMATWVREYTLALEKNADKIESGEITKEEIGRQRMKFVEDRFGEVNWKNMWMDPSIKSALQFFFRSFTWFTGGWKALGKAGIGLGKQGWFKIKGEEVEITQEGIWGINVLIAHMMAVSLVALAYQITSAAEGGDEVPDDEDTPWITRMLFPRIDPNDPYARVSIPSYITEGYKLLAHLGLVNTEAEFKKLLSGRVSSIISNSNEAFVTGEDWRGVSIRNHDDNYIKQSTDTLLHIFGVLPISVSSVKSQMDAKGFDTTRIALSMLGMTEAPAAAKRSMAANLAFTYRRKEFKGKEMTAEEAELKDNTRKAAYLYGQGNREPLNNMLRKQQISKQKYRNALKRIPYLSGRKNPQYQSPLYVALSGLSIDSALKVWDEMSPNEQKLHRPQIIKKYNNTVSRGSKSQSALREIFKEMKEKKIFR